MNAFYHRGQFLMNNGVCTGHETLEGRSKLEMRLYSGGGFGRGDRSGVSSLTMGGGVVSDPMTWDETTFL